MKRILFDVCVILLMFSIGLFINYRYQTKNNIGEFKFQNNNMIIRRIVYVNNEKCVEYYVKFPGTIPYIKEMENDK